MATLGSTWTQRRMDEDRFAEEMADSPHRDCAWCKSEFNIEECRDEDKKLCDPCYKIAVEEEDGRTREI